MDDTVSYGQTTAHGHMLPDIDGPREPVTYADGCMLTPLDDGGWMMTPAAPDPDELSVKRMARATRSLTDAFAAFPKPDETP